MRLCLISFCSLLFALTTQGQTIDTLALKGVNDSALYHFYRYWEDNTRSTSATDALQAFQAGAFRPMNSSQFAFNSGPTRSRFWFLLCLRNDTTASLPLLWSFYNNDISIKLHSLNGNNPPLFLDSLSHLKPLADRYPKVRMPAFFFHLPSGATQTFLASVETLNTDYVYFYSDASTAEDVMAWEGGYTLTNGLYAGFFLFVLILNLCLGSLLRQTIHFWHGAYVGAVLCYTLSENMLDVLLLPAGVYGLFAHVPKIFFLVASLFFSTKVFQTFVRQREAYPKFYRVFSFYRYVLVSFIAVGSLGLAIALPGFVRMGLFYTVCKAFLLLGNGLLAANIVWGIARKDRLVVAYAVASLLFFLSLTDYVWVALGRTNWLVITMGKITVGLAVEIFILTLYFIYGQRQRLLAIVNGLRQSQAEKLALVSELTHAEDNEKQRLAKDLHDDLGSTLNRLLLVMNKLRQAGTSKEEPLAEMEDLLRKAHNDVRNISHELMPLDFVEEGLEVSLRKMCAFLSAHSVTVFQFFFTGSEEAMPQELRLIVYRLFTELSNNVIKHAGATQAVMQCTVYPTQVTVMAEDNGRGMKSDETPKGIGLRNIYSRIHLLNGKITNDSSGRGTTIIIEIPLLYGS